MKNIMLFFLGLLVASRVGAFAQQVDDIDVRTLLKIDNAWKAPAIVLKSEAESVNHGFDFCQARNKCDERYPEAPTPCQVKSNGDIC